MFIDFSKPLSLVLKKYWNGNTKGLRWQGGSIYIKLPKLINCYKLRLDTSRPGSCLVSFEDEDIDQNIKQCLNWLIKIDQYCQKHIKDVEYQPKLIQRDNIYFLKLLFNNETEFYDEQNQLIKNITKINDLTVTHLMALIEIPYILKKDNTCSLFFNVHQIRLFQSPIKRGISLLDDHQTIVLIAKTTEQVKINDHPNRPIPPPPPPPPPMPVGWRPPPPPPPPPLNTIQNANLGLTNKRPIGGQPLPFLAELLGNQLQLKSIDPNSQNNNKNKSKDNFVVDLSSLLKAKNRLKQVGFNHLQ